MAKTGPSQLIVKNRRATFDYDIEERYEAGISLVGSEVKSMRAGKVDVTDAYVAVERGQAWLKQMFVAPFEQASAFPHEPRRAAAAAPPRARDRGDPPGARARAGPRRFRMRLYFKEGRVKVEIGVGKGQEALRQAGRHRQEGRRPRGAPGHARAGRR